MVVARLCWSHTFWGTERVGIAFTWFQHRHVAELFRDRIMPGAELREDPQDGSWNVGQHMTGDQLDELCERIEPMRLETDRCNRCGERHEFADTAHSIDHGQPWEIDWIDIIEHPKQQLLPGMPK